MYNRQDAVVHDRFTVPTGYVHLRLVDDCWRVDEGVVLRCSGEQFTGRVGKSKREILVAETFSRQGETTHAICARRAAQ
jgi:hypothetical protein